MRRPSKFKLRDVTRATKAAIAAGLDVARIEVATDGSFAVVAGKFGDGNNGEASNPWDEVLTNAADKKRTA